MVFAQQASVCFSVSVDAKIFLRTVFLKNKLKSGIFERECFLRENTFSIQTVMWPPPFTVAQSSYKHRERAANKHRL